jgi:hypothetical protein
MTRNEDVIKSEWRKVDGIDHILDVIRSYEYDIYDYLAETVAALCDVDVDVMLSGSEKVYVSQARALFWYAYRYMTNETYEKIANMTSRYHTFARVSVGQSINKMGVMIENEPLWRKRWVIIKSIIKLRDQDTNTVVDTITITIPKHLRDKVSINIKEK